MNAGGRAVQGPHADGGVRGAVSNQLGIQGRCSPLCVAEAGLATEPRHREKYFQLEFMVHGWASKVSETCILDFSGITGFGILAAILEIPAIFFTFFY